MISLCLVFHGKRDRALLEGLATCNLQLDITADTMEEEAALGHAEGTPVLLSHRRTETKAPRGRDRRHSHVPEAICSLI